MRIAIATGAVAAALLTSVPALAATDPLCARLKTFENARFDGTEAPQGRRWVQMQWLGSWLDFDHGWGLKCTHSPDATATELCAFMLGDTSYEFAHYLPMRMMRCYGYRYPGRYAPGWGNWRSDIPFLNARGWSLLEVDFYNPGLESGAIRFSSFVKGKDDALVPLPPMAPGEATPPQ